MRKKQSRIGFTLNIDRDRVAITNPKSAFQAILMRLQEEDGLEVSINESEINFANPLTWNIAKWTPFSAIDSGSVEILPSNEKLSVHFELSMLRPALLAFVLSILAVIGFIVSDVRQVIAAIGCFFPFFILIFVVNAFLFIRMVQSALGWRSS
jgi:hypothetical protein